MCGRDLQSSHVLWKAPLLPTPLATNNCDNLDLYGSVYDSSRSLPNDRYCCRNFSVLLHVAKRLLRTVEWIINVVIGKSTILFG